MLCKKCGADIADTAKFCGFCGSKVEVETKPANETSSLQSLVKDVPNEVKESLPSETSGAQSESTNVTLASIAEEVNAEREREALQSLIGENTEAKNENVTPVPEVKNNSKEKPNGKKSNTLLFVILGVILAAVAVGCVLLSLNKTQKSKTIDDFEKSLGFVKDADSATVNLKLSLQSNDSNFDLSGSSKVQKVNGKYLASVTLDQSLLFDKIELYASMDSEKFQAFVSSTVLDLMGLTSSDKEIWLNYETSSKDYQDIFEELENPESDTSNDMKELLDDKHFKYIETKNGEDHYQLIIDNSLLGDVEARAELEDLDDIDETSLTGSVTVDFYIKDSSVRMEMDLTEAIGQEGLTAKLVLELTDVNSTVVEIPTDALNSTKTIEDYLNENAIEDTDDQDDLEDQQL